MHVQVSVRLLLFAANMRRNELLDGHLCPRLRIKYARGRRLLCSLRFEPFFGIDRVDCTQVSSMYMVA